jgi:DNA-binding transcriptional ArsR family regulator
MKMGDYVSEVGALLGDPVRAAILTALLNGRSLPAGELALIGNVAAQTASFHLGKLLESDLIAVERQGKYRYYRLANEQVGLALESLAAIAPLRSEDIATPRRKPGCREEMQFARTCYRHLAGQLAIQLHNALLIQGLIVRATERDYELTAEGEKWLESLCPAAKNVPILSQQRRGRACLDWTERRFHIGGRLGSLLFSRMKDGGWLLQRADTRVVGVTLKGRQSLERHFGVLMPR